MGYLDLVLAQCGSTQPVPVTMSTIKPRNHSLFRVVSLLKDNLYLTHLQNCIFGQKLFYEKVQTHNPIIQTIYKRIRNRQTAQEKRRKVKTRFCTKLQLSAKKLN
jgi:hypothetical protein